MKTISNTEITIFNTCARQHYYRFRFMGGIQPTYAQQSLAITRGVVGHRILDVYFKALQDGNSAEHAEQWAMAAHSAECKDLAEEFPEELDLIKEIAKMRTLLQGYFEKYKEVDFKVIETERAYAVKISDDLYFAMRLDRLLEMTKGPYRGDYIIFDNKFVYNFKSDRELMLGAQAPKYIETLKQLGYPVSRVIFDQIRYRKDAQGDRYVRSPAVKPTGVERETIWDEQTTAANEIIALEELSEEEHSSAVRRVHNEMICKNCAFADLCSMELRGENVTNHVKLNFEMNTYGYENPES